MIESLVVLALMAAVIWFMVKGIRSPKTGSGGASESTGVGLLAAFAIGAIALVALISIIALGTDGSVAAAPAVAIGVAAVLSTMKGLQMIINWFFGAVGAIAAIPAITYLFTGRVCVPGSGDRILMVAMGILLIVIFALTFIISLGSRSSNPAEWARTIAPLSGLGLFGGLELISFLHTPLGVSFLPTDGLGRWVTALGVTIVIAALSAWRPELVLGTATLAIFVASLGIDMAGLSCETSSLTQASITGLVSYVVAFLVSAAIFGRVMKRRS